MARVVLITGVGRYLGARVAARLSDDRSVTRIIGVDTIPPRPDASALGRAEFVRADIAHPLIATLIDQAGADTVVHTYPDADTAGLLNACERARGLTRLVATTSTEVYGASRTDPAVFSESSGPARNLSNRSAREAAEADAALRAFARRRPEVTVTTLRLAAVVGPTADSWVARYLDHPIALTVLGFDPRLQLVHEYDAVQAVTRAVRLRVSGAINVAGDGIVTLVQALRLAGRLRVAVPPALVGDLAPLLQYSPVADTTRLHAELGYQPRYTAIEALYAHLRTRGTRSGPGPLAAAALAGVQRLVEADS
jgi:UDP-glucose 4-epimerase